MVSDGIAQRAVRPLLLVPALREGALAPVPEIAAMGWVATAGDLVKINARYDEVDLAAAGRSFACHVSQFDRVSRDTLVPAFGATVWKDGVPFRALLDLAQGHDLLALKR